MSVSFNPIGPWPVVALASIGVAWLTIWAYRQRMRHTLGRWRWLALGLRLTAVLMCVLAALRPSVIVSEKKTQPATIVVLLDATASMNIGDEQGGKTRLGRALETLKQARPPAEKLKPGLDVKFFRFGDGLVEQTAEGAFTADGKRTALGDMLIEAVDRQAGVRVAELVVLGDGANNAGLAPLDAAKRLKARQVPVVTVGFGSESAGAASKDLAIRDFSAGPTGFVKNRMQVRGTLAARGFANQTVDVELFVEGRTDPVATTKVKIPDGAQLVPITGLAYTPATPGERQLMLRVQPRPGELVDSNNDMSTFVNVLSGGLNVLYLKGPDFSWDRKFLFRSIASSPDIQAYEIEVRKAASGATGELADDEFATGRYNVYLLDNLPAAMLTARQQRLLTDAVEKGAGLIMLGGRASFGAGGWAATDLARVLPVNIHPGDGQYEPESGVLFLPNTSGLENYVLRIAPTTAETARIWKSLPRMTGINRFGSPKPNAFVLGTADTPDGEPVMVGMETGLGRVLAFAGETWPWVRAIQEDGRVAHRKFWRQVIFWLAHKENQGDASVKIGLDKRRLTTGERLLVSIAARDAKGAPLSDVSYEASVARQAPDARPERIDVFAQGDDAAANYTAGLASGVYQVVVKATRAGQPIGEDKARFLVYQDDRELENPAADLALLRQIAETSGGTTIAPELLAKHFRELTGRQFTDTFSQTEKRLWDNWPFFLIFAAVLMLEWILRKRNGWV